MLCNKKKKLNYPKKDPLNLFCSSAFHFSQRKTFNFNCFQQKDRNSLAFKVFSCRLHFQASTPALFMAPLSSSQFLNFCGEDSTAFQQQQQFIEEKILLLWRSRVIISISFNKELAFHAAIINCTRNSSCTILSRTFLYTDSFVILSLYT